ncbi:MAG: ABC transporter permease [Clostridia bacterium]|nr:ABC transporter permease [Clostridia bacterium]
MTALIINSFREKIRNKTLYVTAIVGMLVMLMLTCTGGLEINGQKMISFKQMVPVGITVINLIGSLLAVMISLNTIPNEFERKTTHLVLVRGIRPWQYMFALTVGNIITSILCVLILFASFAGFCIFWGQVGLIPRALASIIMLSLNTAVISAIVSLFSIKLPAFINGILGILIYFMGVFHNMLTVAAGAADGAGGVVVRGVMHIIPDFIAVQNQASNFLVGNPVDIYPLVVQLLCIYFVLTLTFVTFRKEV